MVLVDVDVALLNIFDELEERLDIPVKGLKAREREPKPLVLLFKPANPEKP